MELTWKQSINIPDGTHQGTIVKVQERTDPYKYTDILIQHQTEEVELKYGCPTTLTENSKLGRLMVAFGEVYEKDKTIDPAKILVGQQVQFMTITKPGKDGKGGYAEIIADSLKPIKVETP